MAKVQLKGKHPNLHIPVKTALAVMSLRILLFFLSISWPGVDTAYLLLILLATIPLVIYAVWPRDTHLGFLENVIAAMRVSTLYGFLISVFTYIFYAYVDPYYFAEMQQLIIDRQVEQSPEISKADITEKIRDFFSVHNFSLLLLILFMVISLFYALFFSAMKSLILKQR